MTVKSDNLKSPPFYCVRKSFLVKTLESLVHPFNIFEVVFDGYHDYINKPPDSESAESHHFQYSG